MSSPNKSADQASLLRKLMLDDIQASPSIKYPKASFKGKVDRRRSDKAGFSNARAAHQANALATSGTSSNPSPLLQKLMLDGVELSPSIKYPKTQYLKAQYDEKGKRREPSKPKSRSIYWTNDQAAPGTPSNPTPYYTVLTLGATLACSAGALVQHTEARAWQQPDGMTSGKTVVQLEQSKSETDVVTPPIAASQAVASFSPRTTANTCPDGPCQDAEFIEHQVPVQANLQALPAGGEPIQANHPVDKLQTQEAILVHRNSDLANREAELQKEYEVLNQQFASLTELLNIHPSDAEHIASLLEADAIYQVNRLELNELKEAIAMEYSKPVADNPQLETLYNQYTHKMEQLRQQAQDTLAIYINEISVDVSDPIWQDEEYYSLLQLLMDTAHFRQMHAVEQNMLGEIYAQLSHQQTELALRKRDSFRTSDNGSNEEIVATVASNVVAQ